MLVRYLIQHGWTARHMPLFVDKKANVGCTSKSEVLNRWHRQPMNAQVSGNKNYEIQMFLSKNGIAFPQSVQHTGPTIYRADLCSAAGKKKHAICFSSGFFKDSAFAAEPYGLQRGKALEPHLDNGVIWKHQPAKNRKWLSAWGVKNPRTLIPQIYRHNSQRKRLIYSLLCIYFGWNSSYGLWLQPKRPTVHFLQWSCLVSIFQTGQTLVISYDWNFHLAYNDYSPRSITVTAGPDDLLFNVYLTQ